MSGYSGSNSSSSTSAQQSTNAFDIAMNAAPSGNVGGGLLNLNLAGLSLKGTGNKNKAGSKTGAFGDAGKSSIDSTNNSGVQLNFLDNQAVAKALDFANNIAKNSKDTFADAIARVANANSTAKATPMDDQISLAIKVIGAIVAVYFIFKAFK